MAEFEAAGVRPVAISVDTPEESRDWSRKQGYSYTFLSDRNADVIRRYGLLHIPGGQNRTAHDIARPAEFLLDRHGVVRWVNFTEDLRVRARAEEMLAAARKL